MSEGKFEFVDDGLVKSINETVAKAVLRERNRCLDIIYIHKYHHIDWGMCVKSIVEDIKKGS